MRALIFLALLGICSAATIEQFEKREPTLDGFKARSRDIFSRALRDFLSVVMEEKQRGAFTAKNIASVIKGTTEETARMLPSSSIGLKMAAGLGGILVGMSAMGAGSKALGRSLSDAYEGFDWRSGISAMARDDFLERTFTWMNVQDVDCKRKIVCEVEQYAANKSSFKAFILRFLSKRHPGLAPYQDAVDNGLDYYDCAAIYDQCPHSFVDIVSSIPVERIGINLEYLNSVPWKLIANKLQEIKQFL